MPRINCNKYFLRLENFFNTGDIVSPECFSGLFRLRRDKDKNIIAWECDRKRVMLKSNSYIDVTEYAIGEENDIFNIILFHYHFKPIDSKLRFLRFDKDNEERKIHANTDDAKHDHLEQEDLVLQINDMNTYYAILIFSLYEEIKGYPVDNSFGQKYNEKLEASRRYLNEG